MSPYEISVPAYAINIPCDMLNSMWMNGIMQQKLPEPTLHYIMGASGSAFALMWNKVKFGNELNEDFLRYIGMVLECIFSFLNKNVITYKAQIFTSSFRNRYLENGGKRSLNVSNARCMFSPLLVFIPVLANSNSNLHVISFLISMKG